MSSHPKRWVTEKEEEDGERLQECLGASNEIFNHKRWRELRRQRRASPVLPPPEISASSHPK